MKKKDLKELFSKELPELRKLLSDKKQELLNQKLDISMSRSNNTSLLKTIKKDIARITGALSRSRVEVVKHG